jgi:hypothetical protein
MGLRSGTKGAEAFAGLPTLCELARRPNVAVKSSALPCYSVEAYPFRDVHPHIRRVYDAFGPRRMFWGTDWTRLPCPWRQAVTLFTEELPWLSGDKEHGPGALEMARLAHRPSALIGRECAARADQVRAC